MRHQNILVIIFLLFYTAPALADVSCKEIGDTHFCSDGSSHKQIGDTVFSSDGTTHKQIGDTTFSSDGTIHRQVGDTIFSSDGTSYKKIGDTVFGSDGSTFKEIGNTTFGTYATPKGFPDKKNDDSLFSSTSSENENFFGSDNEEKPKDSYGLLDFLHDVAPAEGEEKKDDEYYD